MKFSVQEFVDYCATRGDDRFNIMNTRSCAVTQFFQEKVPEITSSWIASNSPVAKGYDYKDKEIILAEIEGLSKKHINALYHSFTFAEIVEQFGKIK